jgi:hypothetical protein
MARDRPLPPLERDEIDRVESERIEIGIVERFPLVASGVTR